MFRYNLIKFEIVCFIYHSVSSHNSEEEFMISYLKTIHHYSVYFHEHSPHNQSPKITNENVCILSMKIYDNL